MSSIFDRHYKRYDSWYTKNKFAYLSELEALKKVVPPVGKGLEIGVGTGRFAAPLGIEYGIDPSKNMLKIAQKRGITVRQGQGERLSFAGSSFDYVAIIITLCFARAPRKVLAQAWRVLRKGGKIIIGIIDKNSFLGKLYRSKKSVFYKQAKFFGIEELTGLLKEARFNRMCYYQAVFKAPNAIKSVEKARLGYGKGGFVVIGARKAFSK